jgi:hypothetical protein
MNADLNRAGRAALIAAGTLFLAACAVGPGGPGMSPSTPYKGAQPWNIATRDGPTARPVATSPG